MIKIKHFMKNIFLPALLAASLFFSLPGIVLAAEDVPDETAAQEAPAAAEETSQEIIHTDYYNQEIQSNLWENWPQGPAIEAQAAIVMDYYTGAVLYSKSADTRLYPASITKIMTTLLACENNAMDTVVTMSETAFNNISEDSSKAYLEIGEQLTMYQMLMSVMLQSANDAAYAVAEQTSGSMKKFVELMNRRARAIGCTNTHFNNPHGLHSQYHYTTARDMAMIMRTAWSNPYFRKFASTVTYDIPPTNKFDETRYYLNNHAMMKTESHEYEGVLGGKTGYTDQAGNTLVTVAKRGSSALVVVVLNGVNGAYDDTAALLDYGFQNFSNQKIDQYLAGTAPKTLPCARLLLHNGAWPSIFEPVSSAFITLPNGVKLREVSSESQLLPNSPGRDRILTSYYYRGQLVGTCTSYEKEILSDLLIS